VFVLRVKVARVGEISPSSPLNPIEALLSVKLNGLYPSIATLALVYPWQQVSFICRDVCKEREWGQTRLVVELNVVRRIVETFDWEDENTLARAVSSICTLCRDRRVEKQSPWDRRRLFDAEMGEVEGGHFNAKFKERTHTNWQDLSMFGCKKCLLSLRYVICGHVSSKVVMYIVCSEWAFVS
jgi:hypothetical protein